MKKCTIEIIDDGKTISMSRKNDGFTSIELVGLIEMAKLDHIEEFKRMAENKAGLITK